MIGKAIDEGIERKMSNFENELSDLIKEAASYGKVFEVNDDKTRFDKLMLFGEKLHNEEYMIGFAGHFSAGKSSMINALTGGDLLPSSPIPTSANIVKVRKAAEDYAVIHLTDGKSAKYEGHGFSGAVKSFSKDGAAVSLVEIGHKESMLPEGITVMDTPGVDSTDDAHRLSTESALHLADLVFYTMDYNHVQSELNFSFTKELMRYNPNVYLIINQIDKHRDSELPFDQFKMSVEASFKMWGVEPKGIFYTSLMVHDHPHNDFYEVKAIVEGAMENWKDHFIQNAKQTLIKLKDEHDVYLQEEIEEVKETASSIVSEDEWEKRQDFIDEVKEAEKTLSLLTDDMFIRSFDRARNELIQNAAITPYETRELLKNYLESLSSRFKVGFLFGAKKTEEERIRRKTIFAENIDKLIHTQIEVHLRLLMKKALKEAGVLTDERSLAVDAMDLSIPFTSIEKQFNTSDVITGDTVLNYANQMKTNITSTYRQLTDSWKLEMAEIITTEGSNTSQELKQKVLLLNEKIEIITRINQLTSQLEKVGEMVNNPSPAFIEERAGLIEQWEKKEIHAITEFIEEKELPVEEVTGYKDDIVTEQYSDMTSSRAEDVAAQAQHVSSIVKEVPSFSGMADFLLAKADRLNGQEFTVALFGAFSAGKSSFSNALIGERILPVSPNPTTATINRIRPVGVGKANETADVILKTVSRMTEDVSRSFEALGIDVTTLEEALDKAEVAIQAELVDEKLQIHKAFIAAFKAGYANYRDALGTVLTVARDEFVKFVAEEERSCFVESIDFYYDCELTRKGITLVDTPGADSINARHTDVAFEYIRNADAILFVTYYNHAFARADREFLVQLGRVKDAFELDKMFFIVNAIDLAKNQEEANEVKSFVANELQQFGIRHPRVHGISSIEALEAKKENRHDPFMKPFEEAFHYFLAHDLRELAIQALEEETTKTVERLASLISRTESNILRKAERLQELVLLEEAVQKRYASGFAEVLNRNAVNELTELVHYILQRVFLRFNDFFREGYNPSTFANKPATQALQMALDDTVNMVGFDITQELQVTNLRMLNFITKQLEDRQRLEGKVLQEKDEIFAPVLYEPKESMMLSFESPFPNPSVYNQVNRLFKNDRSFFEKGDREKLKERLEELLKKDTATYLNEEKKQLEQWVIQWIEDEAGALQEHLLNECIAQIDSERTLLEENEKIEEWRAVYDKLRVKECV